MSCKDTHTVQMPELFVEELKCIEERRKKAGNQSNTPANADVKAAPEGIQESLVGLALSGGGIRSASFNLGLLQAFYRAGLLRHVDYLSTVSGGSYMGGWLSNQILQLDGSVGPDNLPLKDRPGTKENAAITQLIRAGRYLRQPLLLANRYCFGLLKTNLILGSLILLGCAIVAFAWRLLDQPPFCETILVLTGGVLIEAFRPFMVAIILFLSWLIAWLMAAPKREKIPKWVGMVILTVLAAITFGLPLLEWFYEDVFLHPENFTWKLVRPLPLLLLVAWLVAWAVMTPVSNPSNQEGCRTQSARSNQTNRPQGTLTALRDRFAGLSFVWKLYLAGLAGIAGLWIGWYFLEEPLQLPYTVEVFVRVMLLPPSVLYVIIGALRWLMSCWSPATRTLHATCNLRWVLLAAGVSFLIGWAIWLATPNINFIPTTSKDVLPPDAGLIQEHRSWLLPLLGALLTSLLPFLRPQRLLESGLRPKHFWEPWLFRIACTAAVLGLPLVGIYFFGRHNASGFNSFRGPQLLAEEIDGIGFWERINKERKEHADGPGALLWKELHNDFFDDLCHDPVLTTILRQQPVPLSPRARAKEQRLVDKLNRLASPPGSYNRFADEIFHKPIEEQREIANDSRRAKEQWAKWPELKLLLDETQKEPANRHSQSIQAQNHAKINRLLLESQYRLDILDKDKVIRMIVVPSDQWFRFACIVVLAGIAFVTLRQIRLNVTSLHWYYRDQLAAAYLGVRADPEASGTKERPLSQLNTVSKGGPYLLINATLNVPGFRDLVFRSFGVSNSVQVDGCTDAFLFSQKHCGSESTGYQPTCEYEKRDKLRLRDAIALSGAAVSLTQIDNPLVLLFMAILNLRLGQWLPNPGRAGPTPSPTGWDLCLDGRGADERRYFFISDGGHHDNLGLGALLRRRCRLIVVSDATFDPNYTFPDFRRVERRARRELGIRLLPVGGSKREEEQPLSFDWIRPAVRYPRFIGPDNEPAIERWLHLHHYLVARIEYPPGSSGQPTDGYLIYVKPSLTGDEPEELKGQWAEHAEFPHDPTSNQFFDENLVESYRGLGEHIGAQLCRDLFEEMHVDLWTLPLSAVPEVMKRSAATGRSDEDDVVAVKKTGKAKEALAVASELPHHGAHEMSGPHADEASPSTVAQEAASSSH